VEKPKKKRQLAEGVLDNLRGGAKGGRKGWWFERREGGGGAKNGCFLQLLKEGVKRGVGRIQ